MYTNKLTLNSAKSNVILINSKLRDKENFENIKTENFEICITSTVKYLEIHIDEELNFKYHISHRLWQKIFLASVFHTRSKIFFQPLLFYVYITVFCIHIYVMVSSYGD